MFKSFGSVRVLLVEADKASEKGQKGKNEILDDSFYISVSLADDDNEFIVNKKFSSACYRFCPLHSPTSISEEFLFSKVSSTQSLVISLHIIGSNTTYSFQQTVIPVSRLEEDVEVGSSVVMYEIKRYLRITYA